MYPLSPDEILAKTSHRPWQLLDFALGDGTNMGKLVIRTLGSAS